MFTSYTDKATAASGSFFRTPEAAMNHPTLSNDAKLLYTRLLDRMSLSEKNNWRDSAGEVYIYYTVEHIAADLHCGKNKAIRLLRQLEEEGFIRREKQRLCKPDRIYAMVVAEEAAVAKENPRQSQYETAGSPLLETPEVAVQNSRQSQEETPGGFISKPPAVAKANSNQTYLNQTKYNQTENNHRPAAPGGAAGNGKEKSIFLGPRDERGSSDGQRKNDPCLFPGSEEKKQKLGPRLRAALDRMNAALPGSPEYNEAASEYEGLMYQMLL